MMVFWTMYVLEQSPIMIKVSFPSYSSLNNPGVLLSNLACFVQQIPGNQCKSASASIISSRQYHSRPFV